MANLKVYSKVNTKYNPQAAQYIKAFWTKRDAHEHKT